jgi:hypothetical protein
MHRVVLKWRSTTPHSSRIALLTVVVYMQRVMIVMGAKAIPRSMALLPDHASPSPFLPLFGHHQLRGCG